MSICNFIYLFFYFEGDSKIFQVVTLHNTKYHEIWWNRNEHACMANKHKLVIGSCIGSKANHKCYQKKKKKVSTYMMMVFLGTLVSCSVTTKKTV